MRALLLSAYDAASHRHWQACLKSLCDDWQWHSLSLPPRHFSWRVRGNPLYWALEQRQQLEAGYQLLVATSMVDLATLRGLVPALAVLPSVLYFHENQFAYPQGESRHGPLEAQMVSLYSALAADRLVFNSACNRDTFIAGVDALLHRLPDYVPAGVAALLQSRSQVLAVPYDTVDGATAAPHWPGTGAELPPSGRPLRLLWAARLEHDKGGDRLRLLLTELERSQLDYELALTGQQFRRTPPAFERIREEFGHRLVHFGYLPQRRDYLGLLAAADMIVSTAVHEFQGLALLEAVAAGCIPVVPDRLAYPEIYASGFRYQSHLPDAPAEARSAATRLLELAQALRAGQLVAPDVSAFSCAQLGEPYRQLLRQVASEGRAAG